MAENANIMIQILLFTLGKDEAKNSDTEERRLVEVLKQATMKIKEISTLPIFPKRVPESTERSWAPFVASGEIFFLLQREMNIQLEKE